MSSELESWTCICGEANGKNWKCNGCGARIGSWLPPVTVKEIGPEKTPSGRVSATGAFNTSEPGPCWLGHEQPTHLFNGKLSCRRCNPPISSDDLRLMSREECDAKWPQQRIDSGVPCPVDVEFAGYVRGVRFGVFITVGFILALGAAVRIGVAIWEMAQ